jgi:hypothetical protein
MKEMLCINGFKLDILFLEESCKFITNSLNDVEKQNYLYKALSNHISQCEKHVIDAKEFLNLNFDEKGFQI